MRFKLDEHLPNEVAALLLAHGHDVTTVLRQGLGGSSDPVIAEVVRAEGRILATLDRGFADVRNYPPREFAGLVVLRIVNQGPVHRVAIWQQLLEVLEREPIAGELWIVEEHGIRNRTGESTR